jgi:hypothetical protein
MKVYRTTVSNASGDKSDSRYIVSPTPDRAAAKARRLFERRFYSWSPIATVLVEVLGDAVPAGGPVRV